MQSEQTTPPKSVAVDAIKSEWAGICDAMNRGTYRGTEAEALARIEAIKALIAEVAALIAANAALEAKVAGLRAAFRVNMLRFGPPGTSHEEIDAAIDAALASGKPGEAGNG